MGMGCRSWFARTAWWWWRAVSCARHALTTQRATPSPTFESFTCTVYDEHLLVPVLYMYRTVRTQNSSQSRLSPPQHLNPFRVATGSDYNTCTCTMYVLYSMCYVCTVVNRAFEGHRLHMYSRGTAFARSLVWEPFTTKYTLSVPCPKCPAYYRRCLS
jgi:hypothetical protein